MLDFVERGRSVDMNPDFRPSLSWYSEAPGVFCSLLPIDTGPLPEAKQVRRLAEAFYQFSTGVNAAELRGAIPAFSKWSKSANANLSRVIGRCLSPSSAKEGILTIDALNVALGRFSTKPISGDKPSGQNNPVTSSSGRGLSKVAGMHVLKELLQQEVVSPVRNPDRFRQYGLSIPNGILLYGPPGCGKTYIARQLAEELDYYFVEIIPSELASPFIHGSVIKIRDLFDSAAEHAPSIIFIDEFEALVPSRETLGGHQEYKSSEVNEFLAHLNGCAEKNIFIIAATNQPEKIDAAVRRTGRLDKLIYVGPPDEDARREMLALHLEGRPLANDFDLGALAKSLDFYSASDLRFLVDEAARYAMVRNQVINNESFQVAMTKLRPSVTPEDELRYRTIDQRGL
jgi:transitional endoplasmic reticulum ATPase